MTIEERLAKVEQELAELKRRLERPKTTAELLDRIGGSMAAYPEFDEVARLGREFRKADSPSERQAAP